MRYYIKNLGYLKYVARRRRGIGINENNNTIIINDFGPNDELLHNRGTAKGTNDAPTFVPNMTIDIDNSEAYVKRFKRS